MVMQGKFDTRELEHSDENLGSWRRAITADGDQVFYERAAEYALGKPCDPGLSRLLERAEVGSLDFPPQLDQDISNLVRAIADHVHTIPIVPGLRDFWNLTEERMDNAASMSPRLQLTCCLSMIPHQACEQFQICQKCGVVGDVRGTFDIVHGPEGIGLAQGFAFSANQAAKPLLEAKCLFCSAAPHDFLHPFWASRGSTMFATPNEIVQINEDLNDADYSMRLMRMSCGTRLTTYRPVQFHSFMTIANAALSGKAGGKGIFRLPRGWQPKGEKGEKGKGKPDPFEKGGLDPGTWSKGESLEKGKHFFKGGSDNGKSEGKHRCECKCQYYGPARTLILKCIPIPLHILTLTLRLTLTLTLRLTLTLTLRLTLRLTLTLILTRTPQRRHHHRRCFFLYQHLHVYFTYTYTYTGTYNLY